MARKNTVRKHSPWGERQGLWFLLTVVLLVAIALAFTPSGQYWRWWPHGHPALYRINDALVLAIPPEYQRFWILKDGVVRAPASARSVPLVGHVDFSFFLPRYDGYDPSNFARVLDPDRVDVVALGAAKPGEGEPGASGYYPPNLLARLVHDGLEPNARDVHGLRCYQPLGMPRDRWICFGPIGAPPEDQLMLWVDLPPYTTDTKPPMMEAMYFTKRYGGLTVTWRAHAAHLAEWRDIDAHIWQLVAQWNVVESLPRDGES